MTHPYHPRDKAVAVRYTEKTDNAPRVVAKGSGSIAKAIREKAEKAGIPIHRDDALVELLAQIDIDREIPARLYSAIAEILSWIYRAGSENREEMNP